MSGIFRRGNNRDDSHFFISGLKVFFGTWGLKFPQIRFNIVFKPGKVTLNGKTIKVVPSKNKKFPVTKGWFIFTYKTWTYYIRKTKVGFQTFRINKKGKIVKGSNYSQIRTALLLCSSNGLLF